MLDKNTIAQDFPILDQLVHDEPLVYLDNAATTQNLNVFLKQLITIICKITPMFIVESILWLNERQQPMRRRVRKSENLSTLHQPRRCSLQEGQRLDSTGWPAMQKKS